MGVAMVKTEKGELPQGEEKGEARGFDWGAL